MRRITLALASGVLAVVPLAAATVTVAAPTGHSPHQISLSGSVAGGITAIDFGQALTYVFTETSGIKEPTSEDIVLTDVTGADLTSTTCVLPSGTAIHPDVIVGGTRAPAAQALNGLSFCEPGFLHRSDAASMVVDLTVTSGSGDISATACLINEANGEEGACHTIAVRHE